MKKTALQLIIFISLTTILISCSTKKDRFLNRALHGTATKYNVMYHGRVAYAKAKKQLDDNYKDDFFNILPIEPLKIEEEKLDLPINLKSAKKADSQTPSAGGFNRAEEKAVKAIQKHSMNIGGKEKNKQIDDAYFLLGKARYYDQRFIPAIETFKYIIKHYPESPLFNQARIWEAKSLIRLGIEDEAIYKLDKLLELKEIPEHIKAKALTVLAMAYTEQDSTQVVINLLDSTLLYKTKDYNQKARNLFILGQLYRKQNKIDSSNIVFNKLSNLKKAPYRFKVHSKLERAKNYNKEIDSTEQIIKSLVKQSKDRDNRPFLDAIYYQLGIINLVNNNIDTASEFFKKVLRTKELNTAIQSLAYENLGNIKFDKTKFIHAGSYYDSVLNITENKNTKRIRRLIRKRKSLDEVIRLENITTKNDSILDLVSMSKESQVDFFKNYIKELKKTDEESQIIADNKNDTGFGNSLINSSSKQSAPSGKFYFYNAQTLAFGKAEFHKIWGKRDLVDNWRLSNKKTSSTNIEEEQLEDEEQTIDQTKKYDINYYLSKIPTDTHIIDSISKQRNKAYYKLGLIYKEKFKKDPLATKKLGKLLSFEPNESLILLTYYHLYKAFKSFDIDKSDLYKNKIISQYPESRYAQIITNPDFVAKAEENLNSPESAYKKTYKQYLNKAYQNVITDSNKYIHLFSNTGIVPKFELLKAYAIAKTKGREDFIKSLTFVVDNYPNLEEGIHAKKVIASLKGGTIPKKEEKINIPKIKPSNTKEKIKSINDNRPSEKDMLELIKKKKQQNLNPPRK